MTHHLKTMPEYFQAGIDGKKPFEVRYNDRNFKPGDNCILEEYLGKENVPDCPYLYSCRYGEYDESGRITETPIDCDFDCRSCTKDVYSGRRCLIQIKDVYDLTAAGLAGYVAFTYTIKNTISK